MSAVKNKKLRYLSLFSGIGAFEKALDRIGIEYELVRYCEIDKYASKSYSAVHGVSEDLNLGDITEINLDELSELGEIDLITHGSPCQDFSIAGRQAGADRGSETRSSLMWNTVDIVERIQPKYVLWENVKNIMGVKHRHNFESYIKIMDDLGYNSYYQVLNAKDYGIPQNRERVYTVSIRKDIDLITGYKFEFPEEQELKLKLKDMLEKSVDEKYYLSEKMLNFFKKHNEKQAKKGNGFKFEITEGNCIAKSITTRVGACRTDDNYIGTKVRKLTPKECWRLMGFGDEDFEKAKNIGTSDTQLYKQAGNSIVVNVLEAVFTNLLK